MAARRSPSPELCAAFAAALPQDPRVERRDVGGLPAAHVNGNTFASFHGERIVLRLADAARHDLLKLPGAKLHEPTEGKPQRELAVAPPLVVDDATALARWLRRAFDYCVGLPAKRPRPRGATPAPR